MFAAAFISLIIAVPSYAAYQGLAWLVMSGIAAFFEWWLRPGPTCIAME